jgi:hypothetical protein
VPRIAPLEASCANDNNEERRMKQKIAKWRMIWTPE